MWTLDIRAVAAAHQQALRITRPPPPEAIAEGVLGLGTLAGRGVSLCFWLVLRAPATAAEARGWVSAMQRASAGAHPVILLPEGRSIGAAIEVGLSTAALFSAEGAAPVVLARAGEMLGVEVADPSRLVAEGIRFVVEASTSRCWLDGVELVHLSEAGAVMLRVLAAARGALVSTADVEKVISPNRTSRGAASETAARIGEGIRRSFDDAGKAPPADADRIIEALGKKGWRMTVACEVK